jgi:hypothetical protein
MPMTEILGRGNGARDYVEVVCVYAALYALMSQTRSGVALNARCTFWVLFWGWAPTVFVGNYLFYRLGLMSFLPWANDFLHTFVWIGLCLGFLYTASRHLPSWHQFLLFAIYSYITKRAEQELLGTWEHGHFFGIPGNEAYIIGWSLMDGLYPFISRAGLALLARLAPGLGADVLSGRRFA